MGINVLGSGLKSLANPSTAVTLQGGQTAILPSGQYLVLPGKYSVFQFYDPVSTTWKNFEIPRDSGPFYISSDGYNYRLANMTGCVVGAVVTNGGTANTAKNGFWAAGSSSTTGVVATTTTPSSGVAATFNTIVGGAVNTTVTVNTAGSGYIFPPLVSFSEPPAGGLQATGYCTLNASGGVTSVTVKNQGAGYTTAPTVTFTPVPGDPGTGAVATATLDSTNNGKLVALTMANNGELYTSVPTITIAGLAGSPAATAIMCFAITTVATASGATHYGNGNIVSFGGAVTAGSNTTTNPDYTTGIFTPRLAYCAYSTSASLASLVLQDAGLQQVDASNQGVVAWSSDGTIPGATTWASGASGAITDQSWVIPI